MQKFGATVWSGEIQTSANNIPFAREGNVITLKCANMERRISLGKEILQIDIGNIRLYFRQAIDNLGFTVEVSEVFGSIVELG